MAGGFYNKILRVNLSTGKIDIEQPGEKFFRTYFGGWALIAYYLLKELKPGTDPLGPDNLLIFAPGVITGIPAGGSGRNAVGARSPLTGGFGEGDVGGFWGAELKRAGWDAIIVTGAAKEPVYLWIKDDQVELRDAKHLWGKETAPVEQTLQQELGDKRVRVAQTGIAGENLVRTSAVINDITRAAGRTGLGAVMGSKKLKAVAVRGTGQVPVEDKAKVQEIAKWLTDNCMEMDMTRGLHDHGTDGGLLGLSAAGGLPTRNFQQGWFEDAKNITGQTMTETILVDRDTCFACPVRCKRVVKTSGRYETDPVYGGPEYETAGSLGSVCGIGDLEAVAYGNALCNAYGLDTIGAGMTIAWAMECFERGMLTKEDTDGRELRFGNAQAMVELLGDIAHRRGFGDLLAEGTVRAAQKIGRGTEKYAMVVKSQEHPMHEPRIKFGLGLGYAISPTGADHVHNIHDVAFTSEAGISDLRTVGILDPLPIDDLGPAKVRMTKYHIEWQVLKNCLCQCIFMPFGRKQVEELVRATTGWNTSILELAKVGERAMAMARAFNYREGFTAADDVHHWRFATKFDSGPTEGVSVPADVAQKAIDLYHAMSGWDKETGAPTRATLEELGIGWVADVIYG